MNDLEIGRSPTSKRCKIATTAYITGSFRKTLVHIILSRLSTFRHWSLGEATHELFLQFLLSSCLLEVINAAKIVNDVASFSKVHLRPPLRISSSGADREETNLLQQISHLYLHFFNHPSDIRDM